MKIQMHVQAKLGMQINKEKVHYITTAPQLDYIDLKHTKQTNRKIIKHHFIATLKPGLPSFTTINISFRM